MCKEFFNDDKMQYIKFGKGGAKGVLSPDGPYKSFMLTKDIKQFVESVLPKIWSMYFDSGVTVARLENNVAHIKITGIQIKYTYSNILYGLLSAGYKNVWKEIYAKKVRSIASGNEDIYFTYELKDS